MVDQTYRPSFGGEMLGEFLRNRFEPQAQPAPTAPAMAKFRVTGPDGAKYIITAPSDTPSDEIAKIAEQHVATVKPKVQEEKPGMLEAFTRGGLQGATVNSADEIYGAASSLLGGEYTKAADGVRQANKRAQEANPGTFLVGEVAGSLLPLAASYFATPATGGAGAGAAAANTARTASLASELFRRLGVQAGSLTGRMLTGAGVGAGYGAAYGALGADPVAKSSIPEAIGDRVLGGVGGAAVGAAVGSALPPAADLLGAVSKPVVNTAVAWANPRRQAMSKLAEAYQRDLPGSGPIGVALRNKPELFADDGSILADVGGENVRGKMRSALNTPNARRDTFQNLLNDRQDRQWLAIEDQIAKDLGNPNTFFETADKIIARRTEEAGPAFDKAFSSGMIPSKKLEQVFAVDDNGKYVRPTIAQITRDVNKRLIDEHGDAAKIIANNPGRYLHEIKVELDDKIGVSKRAREMGNASSADAYDYRSLVALKRQIMDGIDKSTGDFPKLYTDALKKFGTESGMKNALQDGAEDALKLQPEELRKAMSGMSDAEREMYRLGAARALAEKNRVGRKHIDRVGRDYQSPDIELRLRELVPAKAQQAFANRINALGQQAETRRAAQGNSTTAKQLKEMQDDVQPADMIDTASRMVRTPFQGLLEAIGKQANFLAGMNPKVAAEVLDILSTNLRNGRSASLATITDLQNAVLRQEAWRQNAERIANITRRGSIPATVPNENRKR